MQFQALAKGCYLEGLAIDAGEVWFTDIVGGGVRRRSPDGRNDTWFADRRFLAALQLNDAGVLCSGPGGITWLNPVTGASGMLLDRIDGKPISGVNEMSADREGGMYFGTVDLDSIVKGRTPAPVALYRLYADRRLRKLCDGLKFSNGLGLSPDGRRLYHNESFVGTFAYEISPDGSLGPARMLLEKQDCDGLAVDRDGGVWITGFSSGDLIRVRPDGTIDRRIELPAKAATNVRFAGADGRDLYVNTVVPEAAQALGRGEMMESQTSVLYYARSDVAGLPVERTRFQLK